MQYRNTSACPDVRLAEIAELKRRGLDNWADRVEESQILRERASRAPKPKPIAVPSARDVMRINLGWMLYDLWRGGAGADRVDWTPDGWRAEAERLIAALHRAGYCIRRLPTPKKKRKRR